MLFSTTWKSDIYLHHNRQPIWQIIEVNWTVLNSQAVWFLVMFGRVKVQFWAKMRSSNMLEVRFWRFWAHFYYYCLQTVWFLMMSSFGWAPYEMFKCFQSSIYSKLGFLMFNPPLQIKHYTFSKYSSYHFSLHTALWINFGAIMIATGHHKKCEAMIVENWINACMYTYMHDYMSRRAADYALVYTLYTHTYIL